MHHRSSLPGLWLAPALSLAVALLSGCSAALAPPAPDRFVSSSFVPPPRGSLLLLLHQPAEESAYRPHDADVRKAVQEELVKAGYRVALIEPADHALALSAELQQLLQVSAKPTHAQVAEAELRALATVSRAVSLIAHSQLLLRTRVLNRPSQLWQSYARWDGVSRQIAFVGLQPGTVAGNIEGTGSGISIEAVGVGPDGRFLLKQYGGIALPFASTSDCRPVLVSDPLAVPEQVREGVAIALEPLRGR